MYAAIDRKLQRYRILAALCISEDVIFVTTHCVCLTITVPCKGLTGRYQCIGVYAAIDRKLQGYRILAALCISEDVVMVTTHCVCLTITVPCKGLTGRYQCIGVYAAIDRKLQRYCILAALCISEDVVMVTSHCV